ncbi:hypothetical protein HDU97_008440 [Phlyctochytrium planicorne]|nr:hypothetical protein HDU97_008440 [Phlyctochytrium planicorne]
MKLKEVLANLPFSTPTNRRNARKNVPTPLGAGAVRVAIAAAPRPGPASSPAVGAAIDQDAVGSLDDWQVEPRGDKPLEVLQSSNPFLLEDTTEEMLEEMVETANSSVYPLGHEEFLATVRDFWADDTNNAMMKTPLLTIMTRLNVSTDFIRPIPTLRLEEMKLRFPYMRVKPNCLGDELFRKLEHLCRKRRWERAFNHGLIASDDEGEDETGYFEETDDEEEFGTEEERDAEEEGCGGEEGGLIDGEIEDKGCGSPTVYQLWPHLEEQFAAENEEEMAAILEAANNQEEDPGVGRSGVVRTPTPSPPKTPALSRPHGKGPSTTFKPDAKSISSSSPVQVAGSSSFLFAAAPAAAEAIPSPTPSTILNTLPTAVSPSKRSRENETDPDDIELPVRKRVKKAKVILTPSKLRRSSRIRAVEERKKEEAAVKAVSVASTAEPAAGSRKRKALTDRVQNAKSESSSKRVKAEGDEPRLIVVEPRRSVRKMSRSMQSFASVAIVPSSSQAILSFPTPPPPAEPLTSGRLRQNKRSHRAAGPAETFVSSRRSRKPR